MRRVRASAAPPTREGHVLVALPLRRSAEEQNLRPGRQLFLQDVPLQPAEEEGRRDPVQGPGGRPSQGSLLGRRRAAVGLGNGALVGPPELRQAAQNSGADEAHHVVKLGEVVLDRGAGEEEAGLGPEGVEGGQGLGSGRVL